MPYAKYNNIFNGRCQVLSLCAYVQEQGWTLFKHYDRGSFTWQFSPKWVPPLPDGTRVQRGSMTAYHKGHLKILTAFSYYPDAAELFIDRSRCRPGATKKISINERYRVEHIAKNEYWLYDLENVEKEPDDYRFRLKVRKIR